jgi:hypothetical protein
MNLYQLFPHSDLGSEMSPLFSEEYMLLFFKKFCDSIKSRMWRSKRGKNSKYVLEDFLKVFFFAEISGRSIKNSSESLNEYLLSKQKGRRKIFADGRKKRFIPHQTDINKALRNIGIKKARRILRECLHAQLKEALELRLISKKVNVLIDFTEHPYYGKRTDKMIKGTSRQKGTRRMRHYLGFSILSKGNHLFVGLEHVASGESKVPIIIKFLDNLLTIGFELNYVLMDREFYRTGLLASIKKRGGNVLIPAKAYKKIKKIIEEYLTGAGNRVRKYTFSTAPGSKYKTSQHVYLIINSKKGHSLQDIKRDFRKGKLSLIDARKIIYTIMTTEKPRGKKSSWASRTSRFYDRRWLIETGFSDINRIGRRWKSNYDNVRYLDMLARMLLYNSWKLNRALIRKSHKKRYKSDELTLVQNQDYLACAMLSQYKKSVYV